MQIQDSKLFCLFLNSTCSFVMIWTIQDIHWAWVSKSSSYDLLSIRPLSSPYLWLAYQQQHGVRMSTEHEVDVRVRQLRRRGECRSCLPVKGRSFVDHLARMMVRRVEVAGRCRCDEKISGTIPELQVLSGRGGKGLWIVESRDVELCYVTFWFTQSKVIV